MASKEPSPPLFTEKPVGYHDKPMSFWQKLPMRSDTGGVSPMFLEGREKFIQERMRGMTPERRAWRKQWLQDQVLSPREPVYVPQLYKELNNPFRRFFNYPFRWIESYITSILDINHGRNARYLVQGLIYGIPIIYLATYYAMFSTHDWSHMRHGLRVSFPKPLVYPNDPDYPFTSTKKFDDYYSFGFKYSALYKTEEQIKEEALKSK